MKKITIAASLLTLALLVPNASNAQYSSASLNANGESTFDFTNSKDYVLIYVGDVEKEAMASKVKADYTVDDTKNFLYVWSNTYTGHETSGINSFGQAEGWLDFTVNSVGWSGLGFASSKGNGKNLSMLDDSYILHFAIQGTDASAHASHAIGIGTAKFTIGSSAFVDNGTSYKVLGDYTRDGEWYSFDIPFSVLKKLSTVDATGIFETSNGGATAYVSNVFWALSGGVTGTELQLDGIFFYRNSTTAINDVTSGNDDKVKTIYDIQGREVKDMNKTGLYLIKTNNGVRKVAVK
jgi:hypothetical protein